MTPFTSPVHDTWAKASRDLDAYWLHVWLRERYGSDLEARQRVWERYVQSHQHFLEALQRHDC